jgi:hypothetical protein
MHVHTDHLTLADFIATHGITATAAAMADDAWARAASHWRVTLRCGGRQWTDPFSQGSAHAQPPTAADVLNCVASDIAGVRNARDLDDFMAEYGFERQSDARRTFEQIQRQDVRLQRLLADDAAVETLLWSTERL